MEILEAIKHELVTFKNNPNVEIAGQNPNLNTFKKIWKGTPDWLAYKVFYSSGEYKSEKYKTLNLPRYITRAWANNYANENATMTIPDEKSNHRLQEILTSNNFFGKWNNFVESVMGLGVGAIVANLKSWSYDGEALVKSDSDVKIQFVRGERVYPITIDDGEVTECAFVTYKTGGCKIVIHWLDENGNYKISEINGTGTNGAYNFDMKNIVTISLNSPIPLFQCWTPNIVNDEETEYGTSVFSKAYDAFFQCDVDYTSLYKELKLGQKIKFVSTDMLEVDANGKPTNLFDINDESIFAVEKGNLDKTDFKTFTDELRVASIIQSLNFNMNVAAMLCGLGSNQFEFDGAGGRPIQTATGVIAKQTELYRNVIKQENYASVKLKDMIKAIAFLNNQYTNNPQIQEFKDSDVQITFDDNIMEDTDSKKKNDLADVQAGIKTIAEYRATWYGEDEEEAKKFIQENGMLIDKFTLALQAKVITPEIYVELVFGENYKHKQELIDYITSNQQQLMDNVNFNDESDGGEEDNEDDK